MIRKQPLDPRRLRSRPPRGFGWLDHRLLRQGYLARSSSPALALYCLLVCAGDDHGLSFYRDESICELLRMEPGLLGRARRELMELGLIAYQRPLYQVLALHEEAPKAARPSVPTVPSAGCSRPATTQAASRPAAESGARPAAAAAGLDLRAMVRAALGKGGSSMIDFETYHQLRRCRDELGLNAVQIAAKLGLEIKTVRKWLAKKRYEPRRRPAQRSSKLDPYKETVLAWLEKHPYSGVQILRRLRAEHGYSGGKSVLNDYLRTVRPVRREAFLKLAFEPGDCLQVDWGSHGLIKIGEDVRKLHYFAAVLCYSRLLYVEFFLSQSMECFLAAHRHAFEFFGAAPARVMHDNLKSAVLERRPGEAPRFNPRYLDFALHYGFKPVACNVRRGNEKGRVENMIGYIQKNFLAGLEIGSLEALNAAARQWMEQVANVRLHRETGARPVELFAREKPRLQPLPLLGYDISQSRRVRATNRCQVSFEANRYSVPFAHAGALLELRVEPEILTLYRGEKLIAQHPRHYGRGQEISNPDHTSGLLKERKRGEDAALLARFLALCPQAEAYFCAMRQRELHVYGHVRRILLLAETYGRSTLAAALAEALALGAIGSDYLHNLLQHRAALAPLIGELHLTRGAELLEIEIPPADCSRFQIPNPAAPAHDL